MGSNPTRAKLFSPFLQVPQRRRETGQGSGELTTVGSSSAKLIVKVFLFCFFIFFCFSLFVGLYKPSPHPSPIFFIDSTKLIFLYTFGYTKIPLSNAITFRRIRLQQRSNPRILWQVSVESTAEFCRIQGRNP